MKVDIVEIVDTTQGKSPKTYRRETRGTFEIDVPVAEILTEDNRLWLALTSKMREVIVLHIRAYAGGGRLGYLLDIASPEVDAEIQKWMSKQQPGERNYARWATEHAVWP